MWSEMHILFHLMVYSLSPIHQRGHTSLHESCQEGHTHLSLLLISLGASLHSRSRDGWTPLMCACSHGHHQLANILVTAGADINATTRVSLTTL